MSTGIVLSFFALFFWSISPFCFATTGRKIGPFATNFFRLGFATFVLGFILCVQYFLGTHITFPNLEAISWFAASGLTGLVIGDFFLYRGLASVGPEKTSQIMVLSPAITAALAWIFLHEVLSVHQFIGITLVLIGVSIASWEATRKKVFTIQNSSSIFNGIGAGVFSALFQSIGTLSARQGFLVQNNLDPIMATSIRIGTGGLFVLILARIQGPLWPMLHQLKDTSLLKVLLVGTAAGPIIGMICYVGALKYSAAGIVTTITFMTPLIVIPLGAIMNHTRVGILAILGTGVSLVGVCFLGFNP